MDADKKFLNKYWDEYKKIIINERNDLEIIS